MIYRFIKRAFDILVTLLALVLLSPVFLVVASLRAMKLGRPVLFHQDRPGMKGVIFKLVKFRSMTNATDDEGKLLSNAERLTSFGKKLRALSLDELPTLLNVLRGQMSIVGPRPLMVAYLPLYNKEQARRHDVKPGITGWAQLNVRNAISLEEKFLRDSWFTNLFIWSKLRVFILF